MAHTVTPQERERARLVLAALEGSDGKTALKLVTQVPKQAVAEMVDWLVYLHEYSFAALVAFCKGNGELLEFALAHLGPAQVEAVSDYWLHIIGEKPVWVTPAAMAGLPNPLAYG